MTKKQKEEMYHLFAEAFHQVVVPVLESLATKDDLKREIGFIRDDINGLKADLSTIPTRQEFETLKNKVGQLTT